jgi:exosortase
MSEQGGASEQSAAVATLSRPSFRAWTRSPAFLPAAFLLLALAVAYWDFWPVLYKLYDSPDGYYSHGWLVPVIAGYILWRSWPRIEKGDWLWFLGGSSERIYARWPKLRALSGRPFWPAFVLFAFGLFAAYVATVQRIEGLQAVSMLFLMLVGAWTVAGARWAIALSPAILYLAFGLPLWTTFINNTTNPLQLTSTQVAYQMLKLLGFSPTMFPDEPSQIYLSHYVLNVGVPCSGLKLLLALSAFTVFFILIARLNWWGNLVMALMVVPLSLFINGLRIALIGIVGDLNGEQAGAAFHDYSGYITLIVCFFIVFKIARMLGWKD